MPPFVRLNRYKKFHNKTKLWDTTLFELEPKEQVSQ